MDRKDFLKGMAAAGVASMFDLGMIRKAFADGVPAVANAGNMVAVMGGEPVPMLERMLAEFGGIGRFVKQGQTVVIKPNIGWARTPELAGNTNPELIGALVKQCLAAGAKEVQVFDHTCDEWKSCYETSGMEKAVKAAGGKILPANDESYYVEVELPQAVNMKKAKIHKALVDCDVWFNVPILKNHGGAKMTISMKNYMGIVWDRGYMHNNNLQQCIADICTFRKRPALNIVDAYRVLKQNGPRGKSIEDVAVMKGLFASPDPIAVDTAAVKFFNQVQQMDLATVSHISLGEKLNLGTSDLNKVDIKRIKM